MATTPEVVQSPTPAGPVSTPDLIATMLRAAKGASDLIFSPGRAPQIESNGQLIQLNFTGVGVLTAEDTARRIAADIIGRNSHAGYNTEAGRIL